MLNVYTFTPKNYFGSNMYLVMSDSEYAVIDPSVDYEEVLSSHPEIEGKVRFILLTHCHFDHILKINSWCEVCDRIYIGRNDGKGLSDPYLNCYLGFLGTHDGYFGDYIPVSEGDIISLGKDTFEVIDTPGHTAGGVCYKSSNNIFVGDTLFADGGYGRCDLPGGDENMLDASLVKLFSATEDALIYSGHGDPTTLSKSIKYFM